MKIKSYQDLSEWHRWWAWYPVVVAIWRQYDGIYRLCVWGEWIERRRHQSDYYGAEWWEYREIQE